MTTAYIIANGEPDLPPALASLIRLDDAVICADGGSNHAIENGIVPTLVVGDMDSVSGGILETLEKQNVDIRKFPRDKNFSDLELALEVAMEIAPKEIVCVCVLGGRHDHAQTNMLLLARYARDGVRVKLLGAQWQAQYLSGGQTITLAGHPQDILSLIPISASASGVTITGVKWPLNDTTLEWGGSHTLSNTFEGEEVTVSIGEGLMVVFHYTRT